MADKLPLFQRLSFRQARLAVLAALLVGTIFVMLQVWLDVRQEKERIADLGASLGRAIMQPAARAAYRLDAVVAQEVVESLLTDIGLIRAEIIDDFGDTLSFAKREPRATGSGWIDWLLGKDVHVTDLKLAIDNGKRFVGTLQVHIDPGEASEHFSRRVLWLVISGFAKSFVLSLILFVTFHYTMTKRLNRLTDEITQGDPALPVEVGDGDEIDLLDVSAKRWSDRLLRLTRDAQEREHRALLADSAKSQFLANISHELRTPLNAIIGFADMLRLDTSGKITPSAREEYLNHIASSGTHLSALLQDILEVSKVDATEAAMSVEPLALPEIASDVLPIVSATLNEKSLTLDVERLASCMPVLANRRAMKQLMINAISNAAKFSPPQGTITVHQTTCAKDEVTFEVQDEGPGFPPEVLENLGQPFLRPAEDPNHTSSAGTGLGLYICKTLTEKMGGEFRIFNNFAGGAVVRFCLPRAQVVMEPDAELALGD